VTTHPAHQIAEMAANAAEELRGHMNPADPFPWELTDDDHGALLPRLRGAIAGLAVCIDGIAQMTADRGASRQLAEGAARMLADCEQIRDGETILRADRSGPLPGTGTRPAQLAASGFPEHMTAPLLQAASGPDPAARPPVPGESTPVRSAYQIKTKS
jgi:hypothetical protein